MFRPQVSKKGKTYGQIAKTLARFGAMLLEKGDVPEARYNLEQVLLWGFLVSCVSGLIWFWV